VCPHETHHQTHSLFLDVSGSLSPRRVRLPSRQGAVLGFIFRHHARWKTVEIKAPLGLPPVPIPPDNPPTEETIALGRRLYYDPLLSVDGTGFLAPPAHAPQFAFFRQSPVFPAVSVARPGTRHSPTVINSTTTPCSSGMAGLPASKTGQRTHGQPPVEMAHSLEGVVQRLQADPKYPNSSRRPWGTDQITIDMVREIHRLVRAHRHPLAILPSTVSTMAMTRRRSLPPPSEA